MDGQLKSLWEQFEAKARAHGEQHSYSGSSYGATGAFGQEYWMMLDKTVTQHLTKRYAFEEPLRVQYADDAANVRRSYLNKLFAQGKLAKSLSLISPVAAYEGIITTLSGTDLQSIQYSIEGVRTYRNKVIDYIRSKTDNFAAPSYFTTSDDRIWQEFRQVVEPFRKGPETEANRRKEMEVFSNWREQKIKQTPSLELRDFPRFMSPTEGVLYSAKRALQDLTSLIMVATAFFGLSFLRFLKYDVR